VFGFVEAELAAVGHLDCRDESPAFVADWTRELHSFALELGDRRVDVIAHEVELVMTRVVGGVSGHLGGRQGEDEPAVPGVGRRELEYVSEECPNPVWRSW
jgi:hypothetical protein